MPYEFQVTVDSQRPHELADWWARTLGWTVEPQDESFIKKMIAEGATVLHTGAQGPHTWTTMADPEGNEFCVS